MSGELAGKKVPEGSVIRGVEDLLRSAVEAYPQGGGTGYRKLGRVVEDRIVVEPHPVAIVEYDIDVAPFVQLIDIDHRAAVWIPQIRR